MRRQDLRSTRSAHYNSEDNENKDEERSFCLGKMFQEEVAHLSWIYLGVALLHAAHIEQDNAEILQAVTFGRIADGRF